MKLLRESYMACCWFALCALYEDSRLHRCLTMAGSWCNRQVDTSALLAVLCREGGAARAWGDSHLCRGLTFLLNLPGWLLHKLYQSLRPIFDESFIAPLVFELGHETAIAQSWLLMLLWVIPFKRWNNAYSLLAFAALLCLFYVGAMGRKDFRLDVKSIGFYPVLLFGAMGLGVVFSYAPSLSLRFLFYHVSAALCVVVTVSAVRCGEDLKRLTAGGGFVVLASSVYGIFQRIQGVKVNKSFVDVTLNEGMPGRIDSFFDNPNTFAEVLILLLPLVIALIFCSKYLLAKLLASGVLVLGVAALGMTYSRASWVGFAVSCVVLVFLWKPKLIPLFAILCLLCLPLLPETIWNRILTIVNPADSSTSSRIPLYEAAINVVEKSPVTGAGLGTAAVQQYIRDWNLYHGRAPFVHAHNFYLQVWIEAGLLGVVGFVGALLWNIKTAARTVRHCTDSAARTITCAAAAALCGAMVCGLADYLWNYPRVLCIFWFVFALALAGAKVCRSEASEN